MRIKILNSASNDLINGACFYEKQELGLGDYFMDSIFSDIDSLQIYGGIHQIFFASYYRMLSKRFPFAVYYKIIKDVVLIYAVLDCRRNPSWIKKKISHTNENM